jgi:16S rRNA (cytosine967-C5)-methyltransferase
METGLVYVQDPASAAFLNLPLPDTADVRQILDLCSAPGGKSILLAERYPNASLICSDRSAKRLNRVAENFNQAKRRDIRFPALTVCDARKPPFQTTLFDLVLLDVPCSNTGVFRRRPDALWRFHPKRLAELVRLQAEILQAASDLLRPGGFIIYSTCSIEPDENTRQIRSFLDSHSDYSRILDIEFVPDTMHDGVYAALLKRN